MRYKDYKIPHRAAQILIMTYIPVFFSNYNHPLSVLYLMKVIFSVNPESSSEARPVIETNSTLSSATKARKQEETECQIQREEDIIPCQQTPIEL